MSVDIATLGIQVDTSDLKKGGKALDEFGNQSRKAEQAVDSQERAMQSLSKAVKLLAAAYGALKVAQYIKDATMLAARYETLGAVMQTVGNNAGFSGAQMEKYAKGLEKTGISMISARQTIIRMTQAQLDLSKSSELARVAQNAAVIGNVNSSEAFERMIHGIQSAQVEVLRNIGINVNFENSYKKVANATGRAADSFTEAEKAAIRMNAVLEAGETISGAYEASMETAGKQILSLERHLENLKVILGTAFTPALAEIIETVTDSIKGLNSELGSDEGMAAITEWGNNLRTTLLETRILIIENILAIQNLSKAVADAIEKLGRKDDKSGGILGTMKSGIVGMAKNAPVVGGPLTAVVEGFGLIKKGAEESAATMSRWSKDFDKGINKNELVLNKLLLKLDNLKRSQSPGFVKASKERAKAIEEERVWQNKLNQEIEYFLGLDTTANSKETIKANKDRLQAEIDFYQDLAGFEEALLDKKLAMIEIERQAYADLYGDKAAKAKSAADIEEAMFEYYFDEIDKVTKETKKSEDATMDWADAYGAIGDALGQIGGMFEEGSAAARVFEAAQTAMAIASAVAAVAAAASAPPPLGWANMIAMAGAMATLLSTIGASINSPGGSSSGSGEGKKSASTGLGLEAGESSESFSKSFEILDDIYDMEYEKLTLIHGELQSMNYNMDHLVSSIVRSGIGDMAQIDTSSMAKASNTGDKVLGAGIARYFGADFFEVLGLNLTGALEKAVGLLDDITFGLASDLGDAIGGITGKTSYRVRQAGIAIGGSSVGDVQAGNLDLQQYAELQKSTKRGGHTKRREWMEYDELDAETAQVFTDIFASMSSTLVMVSEQFGMDANEALEYMFPAIDLNFKKKTAEEIEEELEKFFSETADNAAKTLFAWTEQYQLVGEGLYETAIRLATNMQVVVENLDKVGNTSLKGLAPKEIVAVSESLVALAGGIDELSKATQTYYEAFFTEAEQQERLHANLREQFSLLNLELPETREGFRLLVEGLDLTNEAHQRVYVALLKMSGAADDFYDASEAAADAAKSAADAAADAAVTAAAAASEAAAYVPTYYIQDNAIAAAQAALDLQAAQKEMFFDMKEAIQGIIDTWKDAIEQIEDSIRDLTVESSNPMDAKARLALYKQDLDDATGGKGFTEYLSGLDKADQAEEALKLKDMLVKYADMGQDVYDRPSTEYQGIYNEALAGLSELKEFGIQRQTEEEILLSQLDQLTRMADYLAALVEHRDDYLEFSTGTGPAGAPGTGFYKLHDEEVVLNPEQSDRYRAGTLGGAGGGGTIEFNLNLNITGAIEPEEVGDIVTDRFNSFLDTDLYRRKIQTISKGL